MIIYGGSSADLYTELDDGGRYNPTTDSWVPLPTASIDPDWFGDVEDVAEIIPIGRFSHTAVWTGSEMLVWGGYNAAVGVGFGYLDSGGGYTP
jgi:hypothetical protein